jgi:hypothetical protein
MKLSILMPVYNEIGTIAEMLSSSQQPFPILKKN